MPIRRFGPRSWVRSERERLAALRFDHIGVQSLGATVGAEISGVDLGHLDDATFAEIERAFLEYKVIFFRDQDISTENSSTWDPDDGYNARFTNGPNRGELLNSLPGTLGEPIDEYWPGVSGYHMPQNVQAETDMNPNGIRLALKHSNGNQVAPSWYYPIVLECPGANCYRAAIEGCVSAEWLEEGVALTNEPGNMVGPTRLGANNLIAQDSGANWMHDPPGGRYPRGTIEGGMGMASPRLAIVPVFDADIYMEGHQNGRIQAGNAELMVTRFVGIFFQEMQGNTLMGHMMPLDFTPTPTNLSDDPSSFLRSVILVR